MNSSAAASAKGPTVLEPSSWMVAVGAVDAQADKSKSPAAARAAEAMKFFFTVYFSSWVWSRQGTLTRFQDSMP
jgi:hypothetical protein